MPAIGITGGIGTGKSSFAKCLREFLSNAKFFDADAMARELTISDKQTLAEIREKFGAEVFKSGGELNRAELRAIITATPGKRRALEEILHPRIRRFWSGEAKKHRQNSDFFFADIPLLYETGGENLCDRVVVVACSEQVQVERVMQRMKIDENASRKLVGLQMPLSEKIKRADHVVWNNGPLRRLREQAELLVTLWTSS